MDELAFLENASASFEDIERSGTPAAPLSFDNATVGVAERVDATVYNPATNEVLEVSNIIYERHPDGRPPERAYWVGRKLKKCIFGIVKACTVLKFRNDPHVCWEVTEHRAAVKIMSWQKIRELRHVEDPQKEVAAMQFISSGGVHPHVMGTLDVLQDEEYLLMFMPYCSSGDLFGFVQQATRFPEPMARYWFKQILEVRDMFGLRSRVTTRFSTHHTSFTTHHSPLSVWSDLRRVSAIYKRWVYVIAICPLKTYWLTNTKHRSL